MDIFSMIFIFSTFAFIAMTLPIFLDTKECEKNSKITLIAVNHEKGETITLYCKTLEKAFYLKRDLERSGLEVYITLKPKEISNENLEDEGVIKCEK